VIQLLRNREVRLFWAAVSSWTLLIAAVGWVCLRRTAAEGLLWLEGAFLLYVGAVTTAGCLFHFVYRRIHKVTLAADHLMRGDYSQRFPDEGEGDLFVLGHQFNQLSRRLQLTDEQLRREQDRLRQLISDVSHQFKTPLSSLLLFQEFLSDPGLTDEQRREIQDRSRGELHRMERLIESLLTMSRLEAGELVIRKERTDLVITLEEVLASLNTRLAAKHLIVETDWRETEGLAFAHDAFWLGEALANVVGNAIDFTPEHGRIRVAAHRSEISLKVIVTDTGIGIDPQDLPFIFQRFYQGKGAHHEGRGGTGIGLALTRLIVERHDGWIQADSVLGQGTVITMLFPFDRYLTKW
jgi:signal transduction histidine kinase